MLAICGLFVSLPFWFIFAWAIWLEDKAAIFYFQDRCGEGGKVFKSIKFRSMIPLAEDVLGPLQAKENDPRVTKIGKILRATAMDELPQLLNILKGDMSFVGPRVLRPVEIDSEDNQPKSIWEFAGFKERSRIEPGLTGVAQIFAPRDLPRREKFKYDIWYVNNRNFWLDIKLVILSFFTTFRGKWETRKPRFKNLAKSLHCQILKELP